VGASRRELGRLAVLHRRVEGAVVGSEDFLDALCRAAGDVGDGACVCVGRHSRDQLPCGLTANVRERRAFSIPV